MEAPKNLNTLEVLHMAKQNTHLVYRGQVTSFEVSFPIENVLVGVAK